MSTFTAAGMPTFSVPTSDEGLPSEVWSTIFEECIDPERDCFDTSRAPWLTSQVCRSWRSITHSTPRLWSYINLEMMELSTPERHLNALKYRLAQRLEHAKDYPLIIAASDMMDPKIEDVCMETLWPLHASWRKLSLCLNVPSDYSNWDSCTDRWFWAIKSRDPEPMLPSLIHLGLTFSIELDEIEDKHEQGMFYTSIMEMLSKNAPSLKYVDLQPCPFVLPALQSIPWHQLRVVNLSDLDFSALSFILPLLSEGDSAVYRLELDIRRIPRSDPVASRHILLPNLVELEIVDDPHLVLSQLIAPTLHTLQVEHVPSPRDFAPDCLSSFLSRSNYPLQTLCIQNVYTTPIYEILRSLPELECLEIGGLTPGGINHYIYHLLDLKDTSGVLIGLACPKLTTLILGHEGESETDQLWTTFGNKPHTYVPPEHISILLGSRRYPGQNGLKARLLHAEFVVDQGGREDLTAFERSSYREVAKGFRGLRDAGMIVEVVYRWFTDGGVVTKDLLDDDA